MKRLELVGEHHAAGSLPVPGTHALLRRGFEGSGLRGEVLRK